MFDGSVNRIMSPEISNGSSARLCRVEVNMKGDWSNNEVDNRTSSRLAESTEILSGIGNRVMSPEI